MSLQDNLLVQRWFLQPLCGHVLRGHARRGRRDRHDPHVLLRRDVHHRDRLHHGVRHHGRLRRVHLHDHLHHGVHRHDLHHALLLLSCVQHIQHGFQIHSYPMTIPKSRMGRL